MRPTLLWTSLLIGGLLASATATAHSETEEAPSASAVFFLNSDGANLTLSTLPPSSSNATSYHVQLQGGYAYPWGTGRPVEVALPLSLPGPAFEINETAGLHGQVAASVQCQSSYASLCGGIQLQVFLVQGAQRVLAGTSGLGSYERAIDFEADFPGHGDDARPHTHGDGSDADRGLYTGDVSLLILLTERTNYYQSVSFGTVRYDVAISIDGHAFAALSTQGPAPSPPSDSTAPAEPEAPADPDEPPENGNGTQGNASANSTSGGSSAAPVSVGGVEGAQSPGVGVAAAVVGIAASAWRRSRSAYTRAPDTT